MKIDTFNQQEIGTIVDRAFNGERVQVLDHRLVRYSKDKIGFLGNHQSLEVTIKRDDNSEAEVHRFFVKTMPQVSEEQLKFIRERNLFSQEAIFFNQIVPELKKSCAPGKNWCPKCLLADDKFVVLEDMKLTGYVMSTSKMLNVDQLYAAFRAQARLHAASLIAERQLGKPLNELYPKGCAEQIFNDGMFKYGRFDLYVDFAEKVAQRLGRDNRRIRAGFQKAFNQMYDQRKLSNNLPKVLCHGDAWSNNYLFDTSDPPNCIIVDYQLTRYGPRMYDLAMLAYLSSTRDQRRKEERKAIEVYLEELCEVLEKNDPAMKRPTLKELIDEYEEMRLTALFCASLYYPIILVDKSIIAKYGEQKLYNKLMFRIDNSFVMQVFDEDKAFATRVTELIEEVVEYFEEIGIPIGQKNDAHL